jgi:putative resolvase
MSQFQSLKSITSQFELSAATLRHWARDDKIEAIRTSERGRRLYNIDSVRAHLGITKPQEEERIRVIYARVSSSHQKEDLQRQISDLQCRYPGYEVIQDVASGLNFRRKGLQTLLGRVIKGMVSEVVVTYKDRLCRYGIELLEFIFEKFGTKLLVYSGSETISETRELADDLLAITTVFVARHNGRRSQANRRKRKAWEADCGKDSKNPSVSDFNPEN